MKKILILNLEVADGIKKAVDSVGKFSAKNQKELQEYNNAKFNLWVAKEFF
jgi:hypothetical protein